ncbi:hypothetical protein [Dongia mobilis]|uniref:hypothetical protein n=1 Tax=Dongia mobilis TaxID=578943 RepID=UPI00105DD48F|nr:hypothetical protein [Dongia mobilis]
MSLKVACHIQEHSRIPAPGGEVLGDLLDQFPDYLPDFLDMRGCDFAMLHSVSPFMPGMPRRHRLQLLAAGKWSRYDFRDALCSLSVLA